MTLTIQISWADEVTKKLSKLWEKDLAEARNRWLKESAVILQGDAKKEAPVRNWLLRKNIQIRVYPTYAEVYNNLNYAEFVHEWTNPHIILPKFKKALHWIDPDTKEDRFALYVRHPWYKGNPFFTRAVDNNKDRIIERFNSIIKEYLDD